jgi:hypothetical protein
LRRFCDEWLTGLEHLSGTAAAGQPPIYSKRRSEKVADNENRMKVTILTGTYRVKGFIEIVPGARVTDYLVEAKNFIAVTDAEVRDLNDRHIMNTPFLNVSLECIQIVAPQ